MTRLAACQVPDIRGDIDDTLRWITACAAKGTEHGARLLVFPEGFLQGYTTDAAAARRYALDLESRKFAEVLRRLRLLRPMLVIGVIENDHGTLFNSAMVVERGELVGTYRKTHLLAAESVVFAAGNDYPGFDVDDVRFGINICYDTNFPEPAAAVASRGARVLVCPANNMLPRASAERWKPLHNEIRLQRVRETGLWLLSSDVTGATSESVGYGPTALLHPSGRVLAQVPLLEMGMVIVDIDDLDCVASVVAVEPSLVPMAPFIFNSAF